MNKLIVKVLSFAAVLSGVLFVANCGGGATTPPAKNEAPKTEASKPSDAPKTEASKPAETASTDSVGVAECDEYIKKYEACLTKIAAKAPQVKDTMNTAFKAQRDGFKQAAANPSAKATLATTCKQAIETAKQSTSAYACEW